VARIDSSSACIVQPLPADMDDHLPWWQVFGDKFDMHEVTVLTGLTLWSVLWGIPGAVLSVPCARRFHPLQSILTEICICHTCSCHAIVRMETPGQDHGCDLDCAQDCEREWAARKRASSSLLRAMRVGAPSRARAHRTPDDSDSP
jgi:hypothetical protein